VTQGGFFINTKNQFHESPANAALHQFCDLPANEKTMQRNPACS
jgi:hypothetical protein